MASPNILSATSIVQNIPFFNPTPKLELQDHNTTAKCTDESSSDKTISDHHVIDLKYASSSTETDYALVLSFNKLSYSVKVHPKMSTIPIFCRKGTLRPQEDSKTKVLLDNIWGEAREGEIMAILGASGAGKSTLIDALAGRIEKESLKGTVSLNGEVLDSRHLLKVISAYVMQDDILFPFLTVEETLMFSAEFRLPRSFSKAKKQARIQVLIDQLGLRSAANTIIGDEQHRGVSGGERRRVSIGIDIVHDPILLFLDEPTSGLDSTSAFIVVKVLQRIAKSGSILIMSIHQPSCRILSLLDRSVFLSHGRTVYSGALATLSQFFAEFGHPVPSNANQTEFVLDLIREFEEIPGGITSLVKFNKAWQTEKNANKICDKHKVSLKDAIKASIAKGKLVSAGGATNDSKLTSSFQTFANPFWTEVFVISKRLLTNSRRTPELFQIRLGAVFLTAFILGTLYWRLDDSPKGAQGRLGFLASAMTTIIYLCAREIPAYLQERYIFLRETAYNTYRCSSYVVAHCLVSIPSMIILSLVFVVTTFWAVGLAGGFSGFFFFFITIFASFWAGSSFMAFFSGLVTHVMVGFTMVAAIVGYFLIFSGFYIHRDQIPSYWIWCHYISLVKYPYQAALQNEYEDHSKCFAKGVQLFDETPFMEFPESMKMKLLESMKSVLGNELTSSTSCLTTGMKILEQIGATDISKWSCFWITIAFGFLFRVLFYLTLLFGNKNKRR